MWTDFEISKLGELYLKLSDEKLEDFFPSFIIDAIKAEEGKAYVNLRLFYTLSVLMMDDTFLAKAPTSIINISIKHHV